jgi:hypothetical protein
MKPTVRKGECPVCGGLGIGEMWVVRISNDDTAYSCSPLWRDAYDTAYGYAVSVGVGTPR